jgi:hypothetical protein
MNHKTDTTEALAETRPPEAWITEEGDAVVWGTHDPAIAATVYAKHLVDVGIVDDELQQMTVTEARWRDAGRFWGSPKLLEPDDTEWIRPSTEPVDDWTPYLIRIL